MLKESKVRIRLNHLNCLHCFEIKQLDVYFSFQGFTLEDATGLAIKGDVDVHSVHATSLPTSHPSFSPQRVLDFLEQWKSRPLPLKSIQLFIGVLSATNHFAERMAVRKTWMQSSAIRSLNVVVRFFVALVISVASSSSTSSKQSFDSAEQRLCMSEKQQPDAVLAMNCSDFHLPCA